MPVLKLKRKQLKTLANLLDRTEALEEWIKNDGRDMDKLREALFGNKTPPSPTVQ